MKNKIFMVLALAILCCSISTSYAAANLISPAGFGVVSSPILIEFNSTTLPAGAWTYDLSIYNGIMGTTDTLAINVPSTIDEPNSIPYSNLKEGFNYLIELTVYDPAPTTVSQWITIDLHAPVVSIETANLINSTELVINVTANDAMLTPFITNISVVDAVTGEVIDSTINPSSGSYQVTLTVFGDGIYNVTANATDMAGNSKVAKDSVTVDTTAPLVTINNPELDYNYSTNILNVTVDDVSVDTVIAEIDNGSVLENITLTGTNGYFGNSTHIFAQGEYDVRIYANDSFGRVNSTETVYFMVDWIAPEVTINNPVNGVYTNITNTTLNFTITDNVCESVICNISVNGNLINSSEANTSLTLTYNLTLNEGENNITITAIDDVGNIGENSTTVFIDSNNPVVVINTGVGPYNYNSSILNVTVTDTTPVTVIANITDQGMNITLNKTADGYFVNPDFEFIDGVHNVTITATDAMGNVNSTETIQFMVDTTGPEFTIHSPINTTVYTVNHFIVNITAEDLCGVDNIKSDIDGWVVTLAEYPTYYYVGYTGMPDENYTIIFTATDDVGNTAVKEIYVIVDTKPPEITINYPINGSYNTTDMFINATLTDLSGIKNATAELNGINYPLNENNDYYTLNKSLSEGDYVLKVYATDDNNNTNVSDVVAFTIDTTYPEVTIETANISDSKDLTTNVTATDEKSGLGTNISVINALTGDLVDSTLNFTNGTYQVSLSVTTDGLYNVTATTMDAAGNINTTEPSTVVVDTTVPTVTINHVEDDYNHSKNILNVTVTDATPVFVIAEITNETISKNITLENISGYFGNSTYEFAQGEYFVRIYAEDIAGNLNSSETIDFMVDWIAPEVSISNPVNGLYMGVNGTELNFTITDNVCESVICNISVNGNLVNSSEANTSITLTYNLTLNEGENNITITAIDDVGNIGENTTAVTVDTTNPTVVINNGFGPYNYNSSILNVTATDTNLDSVVAEINGLENITLNGSTGYFLTSEIFNEGLNTVKIYANDLAGNVNSTENVTFRVDLTDPVITVNTVEGEYFNNGSDVLNFTVDEDYIDSATAFNGSTEISLDNSTGNYLNSAELADGVYNVTMYANDTASNKVNKTVSFTVDTVNPEVTVNKPVNGTTYTSSSATINVTANDSLLNVSSVIAKIGSVRNVTLSFDGEYYTGNTGTLSNGNYEITIIATDLAGNVNSSENVSISIAVPRSSSGGGGGSSYSSDLSDGITSSVIKNVISDSDVVYGNSIDGDYAEELRENLYNAEGYEIDRNTIIVGGPNANVLANKYDSEFGVSITNDYPGENRGVIQIQNIQVHVGNFIKTYQVIYIAGSDRFGTQAALEYFKTLDELPSEPTTVKWTANGPVLVE
ncbi:hypothetical protein HNP86_001656 [Methanococcus maripaludis]|uniref:Bacterial Ig-like domain-containing protein n=1 Tax=Methanococcus maripaludis TaxID=39152 RepID=A0A7J9NWW7_METMI|nr:Ig-like domain-containing protein [Methanococcus maripaludis]MBA2851503.1 hypothetical protein [Methanococcus maripaludis]